MDLSIYAFVGIIMLIGIVKKNAIMMIDFAIEAERREGKTAARGDPRGGQRALPADHDDDDGGADGHAADRAGHGAGAESRRPLGIAVVGGLLFSQLITLYITPVVYTYLDAWQQRLARRRVRAPKGYPEAAARRSQGG